MNKREFLRAGSAAAAIVLAGNPAWAQSQIPAGYPADYAALLEGSRSEPDTLIYSNLQLTNWAKVLQGFKARYPWTNVKIVDLGSETFERYYAETATGGRTADMILSGGVDGWHEFVQKSGAKPYASPEAPSLPAWAQNAPGVYTVARDPALIIYNKRIISGAEAPKSLHAIAELIEKRPDLMKRLTTQSVSVSFGRAAAWAWIQHNKDAWDILQTLGPATRPERAVGGILEKISTGEHAIAWGVNASALFAKRRERAYADLLGWSFVLDGTPIVPRRIAVTANAQRPMTAKLMLDFLLSHEGQVALGATGVTPYRPDVKKDQVLDYTYDAIVEAVGAGNVAFDRDDAAFVAGRDAFVKRWRSLLEPSR